MGYCYLHQQQNNSQSVQWENIPKRERSSASVNSAKRAGKVAKSIKLPFAFSFTFQQRIKFWKFELEITNYSTYLLQGKVYGCPEKAQGNHDEQNKLE